MDYRVGLGYCRVVLDYRNGLDYRVGEITGLVWIAELVGITGLVWITELLN